jgi:protein-S-isoprenylcysteine O-methyltransferase Ste14
MVSLELRVPPLAIFVLVAVAMRSLAGIAPALSFAFPGQTILALGLVLAGVLIGALALGAFRRAQTTFHPMRPGEASTLVTSGVYRYSRNPMYLGVLLVLWGWAVHLDNALAFIGLPVFVAYLNRFQIKPEERALRAKFGAAYADYAKSVGRWL